MILPTSPQYGVDELLLSSRLIAFGGMHGLRRSFVRGHFDWSVDVHLAFFWIEMTHPDRLDACPVVCACPLN